MGSSSSKSSAKRKTTTSHSSTTLTKPSKVVSSPVYYCPCNKKDATTGIPSDVKSIMPNVKGGMDCQFENLSISTATTVPPVTPTTVNGISCYRTL